MVGYVVVLSRKKWKNQYHSLTCIVIAVRQFSYGWSLLLTLASVSRFSPTK